MKLKLGKRAQAQAARIEAWWAENRPAAPQLFARELRDTLERIQDIPGIGMAWRPSKTPGVKRVLMLRTQHHVYFRVEKDFVHVLAVWGVPLGRGPRL